MKRRDADSRLASSEKVTKTVFQGEVSNRNSEFSRFLDKVKTK